MQLAFHFCEKNTKFLYTEENLSRLSENTGFGIAPMFAPSLQISSSHARILSIYERRSCSAFQQEETDSAKFSVKPIATGPRKTYIHMHKDNFFPSSILCFLFLEKNTQITDSC